MSGCWCACVCVCVHTRLCIGMHVCVCTFERVPCMCVCARACAGAHACAGAPSSSRVCDAHTFVQASHTTHIPLPWLHTPEPLGLVAKALRGAHTWRAGVAGGMDLFSEG